MSSALTLLTLELLVRDLNVKRQALNPFAKSVLPSRATRQVAGIVAVLDRVQSEQALRISLQEVNLFSVSNPHNFQFLIVPVPPGDDVKIQR